MITKYNNQVADAVLTRYITRLVNQVWKLIPMRENNEDWQEQLRNVIVEVAGIQNLLSINTLILLAKLEGLLAMGEGMPFHVYRKTVFRVISLLGGLSNGEQLR